MIRCERFCVNRKRYLHYWCAFHQVVEHMVKGDDPGTENVHMRVHSGEIRIKGENNRLLAGGSAATAG
jgi:hypothetical protein